MDKNKDWCPVCKELVGIDLKICPKCGKEIIKGQDIGEEENIQPDGEKGPLEGQQKRIRRKLDAGEKRIRAANKGNKIRQAKEDGFYANVDIEVVPMPGTEKERVEAINRVRDGIKEEIEDISNKTKINLQTGIKIRDEMNERIKGMVITGNEKEEWIIETKKKIKDELVDKYGLNKPIDPKLSAFNNINYLNNTFNILNDIIYGIENNPNRNTGMGWDKKEIEDETRQKVIEEFNKSMNIEGEKNKENRLEIWYDKAIDKTIKSLSDTFNLPIDLIKYNIINFIPNNPTLIFSIKPPNQSPNTANIPLNNDEILNASINENKNNQEVEDIRDDKYKKGIKETIDENGDGNKVSGVTTAQSGPDNSSLMVKGTIEHGVMPATGMRTILKNRSMKCKICKNDLLFDFVAKLRLDFPLMTLYEMERRTNEKYGSDLKIISKQLAIHLKYHFIVKDNFSSSLVSLSKEGIPLSPISNDEIDELINNPLTDMDFVRKQRKIMAIKMRRLHGFLEWIENIEAQMFEMDYIDQEGNKNIEKEFNFLNVPKDFYAMNQMAEMMENSIIETLEKLDKKVHGRQVDFYRLQNFLLKLVERIDLLYEEIGPRKKDEIDKFKSDVASLADEISS